MNRHGFVTVVVLASSLLSGCAKQPASMVTAAPAPTGTTSTTGPTDVSSPTGRPESTPPMSRSEATPLTSDQRGGATGSGARPAPSEFVAVRDLVDIYFDFDKYAIRPRDTDVLQANARWLQANKNALVLIEGHCDERGTEEYNLALGDRRAKAAVDYLVAQGIAPARLVTISYGKAKPQCADQDEACRAKNRRAHFLVKRG